MIYFRHVRGEKKQKGKPMLKVPYGQDPYSVIGKYIRDHITAIEDIIAVIEIDDITTNQLLMVDMNEDNYFIWNNDWYEGEKDVALIDFFPVSEAINPSVQPESCEDVVSREDAINALDDEITITGKSNAYVVKDYVQRVKRKLENLPSVTPKPRRGKWITSHIPDSMLWECDQCGFACGAKSFDFCPNCGVKMNGGEQE